MNMYYHYKANDGTTFRFEEELVGDNNPDGEALGVDGLWYPREDLAISVYGGDFRPVAAEEAVR